MTPDNTSDDLMIMSEIAGTLDRPKNLDAADKVAETYTLDEVQLPRLAIAQGLSPQLVPTEGKYIKGLVIGQMFNDVTSEIYGEGPVTVVPVKDHTTRIEFDPNDRTVPIDRDVPAGDPRLKWTKDANGKGVPPRATEFAELVCLLLRPGKPPEKIVVSIKQTNKQMRAAAKLWRTHIALRGTKIYTGLYTLTTKIITGKNKDGQPTIYGVFIEKNAGFIPSETPAGAALLAYARDFAASLEGKKIIVERETEEVDVDDTMAANPEEGADTGGM
jgi:hypothetical protein